MSRLSVDLLGPPQVEVDGRPIEVDTRKAIALVAYLAATGHPHARDSLAGLLWPERDDQRARGALRRTLSALRRAIGDEALDVSRERIGLRRGPGVDVDLDRFRAAIAADGPAPAEALERAVAIYRDDFLAGFALRDSADFDDWQAFEADALRRELAGALDRLVQALAEERRWAAAIRHARRRLRLDPLQEPAHRQLIRLYARSGDRAAALAQYRDCVRTLSRELGVPPLPETTALYRAVNEGDLAPPPAPSATAEPAREEAPAELPMVGRAGERRALLDAWEGISAGGRVVVVEGEPGIGKTRLVDELAAQVRSRGAAVLTARCHEDEAALPYAAVVGLLRSRLERGFGEGAAPSAADLLEAGRLVPGLASALPGPAAPPALDGPGAQGRMLEGIAAVLLGPEASSPTLAVVDDIHWADDASLDALGYLVRRLAGRPFLLAATWREEEVPAGARARRLLADAERAGAASVVRPERLTEADVVGLVRSLGRDGDEGLGRRLHRDTEGLPVFIAQWLAAGGDAGEVPTGVRALVRERVAGVPEAARQLLTTAAVIGRSFSADTARAASGRSDEEAVSGLEELERRGLIREVRVPGDDEPAYDFTHEILRSVVYDDASLIRRRLLHGRVADALTGAGALRGRSAAVVAGHLELAGRDDDAARAYAVAAERAAALYANADALAALRSALALGHPDAARLHERCGDLQTLLGDYAGAIASYETAAAEGGASGMAAIEHKLGGLHHRRGDPELAESHFAAALAALEDDDPRRARILADRSLTAQLSGDGDGAVRLARDALAVAERAGEPDGLARAHNILGVLASADGRLDQARDHLCRSLDAAEAIDDQAARVAALNNLALLTAAEARDDEALALFERAIELCARLGDRHREAALRNNMADLLHGAGRSEDAMAQLKRAVAIFAEVGAAEPGRAEIWKLARW